MIVFVTLIVTAIMIPAMRDVFDKLREENWLENELYNLDFSKCTPPCKMEDLAPELQAILYEVRKEIPVIVNSGYRPVEWEKARNRSETGAHPRRYAVDVHAADHWYRLKLVGILLRLGVKRIGIAKTFVHFDVDPQKPASMWLYYPDNYAKTF